jgi:hypothetical protein
MRRLLRIILGGMAGVLGLIIVLAIGIGLFFDVNRYKPQIESSAAKATGMELKINGDASLRLFPHIHVSLKDVHLSNRGSELFAASELKISSRLLPFLLHRKVVVDQISLISPKVKIVKSAHGQMNFETAQNKSEASSGPSQQGPSRQSRQPSGSVRSVIIKDGELAYVDQSTGKTTQANGVSADFSRITWGADPMKSLSLTGDIRAQSLRAGTLVASNVKAGIKDRQGLITLAPTEVSVFGGTVQGSVRADLRSSSPKLEVAQTASHIDLSQALAGSKNSINGFINASVQLAGTGATVDALTQSAKGEFSLNGRDLTLHHVDVDALASQLKSAQGLDLIHLGSALLAGPLAQTLDHQAAGTAGGAPETESKVRNLVSDWNLSQGVATAKDVALSTDKTMIAFSGKVHLLSKKLQDFYIATVDPKGCTKQKVEIGGTLSEPRPLVGSFAQQLGRSYVGSAGSALGSVGSSIAGVFGGKPQGQSAPAPAGCDRFYSGSLAQAG